MNVLQQVAALKLLPVIKLDRAKDAAPLAEALCAGKLPVAEVTFRTDAAAASIETMTSRFPQMLVGAGSVSSVEQAKRAIDAGAKFLVCAGFSRRIVEFAVLHRFPIFPGVCTPTELLLLLEYDLPVAKVFPAAQYGGLATIKALSAPFPQLQFMPTGGISAENVREYLEFPKVIACGGSWMVKSDLINAGEFDTIRRLTQEAVDLVVDL